MALAQLLDRAFRLREAGTSVRTELVAGATTFVTLSYILFVQPAVLSDPACGMDASGVLFATCVASAVACFLMAWWGKHPIALAPAMGQNFFFAFTVCAAMGFTWQEALAANLIAGLVFLSLSGVGFREAVMHAIPTPLMHAISAGIGLLIALVGLEWAGIVVDHPVLLVAMGDLTSPVALLSLFGLLVCAVLLVRGVPGGLLIGVFATAAAGLGAGALGATELVRFTGVVGAPPSPSATAFQLDLAGLFARPITDWLTVIAVFVILDLFDTVGTLVGVADRAGLLEDGRLPRARGALAADAAGTSLGALLGTSTVTSYVESAAGVAAGGRTGLTALTTGVLLLLALFFRPLVEMLGGAVVIDGVTYRPVIAPVLILIGVLMIRSAARIEWDDVATAIPAFLTMAMMMLSVSITEGIAFGFLSWSLLSIPAGRFRRTPALVHLLALLFLLRYVLLEF